MKVVLVTQTLDPEHGSLAQTLDLVTALAARCDEVVVLARTARWQPPVNVHVTLFDAKTKIGRALAFERALHHALPADAVLVHMVPTFSILAAPLAKARRTPLLLWYTHWHASRALRVADALSDVVLSVDRASYPLHAGKLRPTGHAIDVARFDAPPPEAHDGPLRLLAFGRTARWKGLDTLVDAFRRADPDATLEIRGPSLTDDERAHRAELEAAAAADDRIRVEPPIPRADVPALLRSVDVVVSPAQPERGAALDKAVYEAAACSRPVVTTNQALAPFLDALPLPLVAPPRDAAALADVLRRVVEAPAGVRATVGAELRRRVVARHSLDHWAAQVVAIVTEVRSRRGG